MEPSYSFAAVRASSLRPLTANRQAIQHFAVRGFLSAAPPNQKRLTMRDARPRHHTHYVAGLEAVEPRLLMSAQPSGQELAADYLVEGQGAPDLRTSLADAHHLTGLDRAFAEYGLTGQGQTVAIIDTGIAYDHPALGGGLGGGHRVVGGWDFTENDANPYDDGPYGSHGTHVAGIVGSSDATYRGVAPGVDLVSLRVFDDAGEGSFAWVEKALDWVHDHRNSFRNPITAVNLSIGTTWNSTEVPGWSHLEDEFAQLEKDGIFTAVAAGNAFQQYHERGLSYPAASSHVVPVSSLDDDGTLSSFSQRQDRAIAAPGRTIMSTVPDYRGNQNGRADDFVSYSGTSMASPYVAGASVLLREALALNGKTTNQDGIERLMRSTADTVYDPETGGHYLKLNLARALDAAVPDDEYGSSPAAAFRLGTVSVAASRTGVINALDDEDFFTFTAGASGAVTVSAEASGELRPTWELAGGGGSEAGGNFSFNVIAGRTYTLGLGTGAGLGRYDLNLRVTASAAQTDWGTVDFASLAGQNVSGGRHLFGVTAARTGTLSIEALFDSTAGNIDLNLYDRAGQLLASSRRGGDYERLDVQAAKGETFTLDVSGANRDVDFRVANLLSVSGGTATVNGTSGGDRFEVWGGDTLRVRVNDVDYRLGADVDTVAVKGRSGGDCGWLYGGADDDAASLRPGSAELAGDGYRIQTSSVETLTVQGGGGDNTARIYDSTGNDTLTANPARVEFRGSDFSNAAKGFQQVQAVSSAGVDKATLAGSGGNDFAVASPDEARLYGSAFDVRVDDFAAVTLAAGGGFDQARLYDSAGDDWLIARPDQTRLKGTGFDLRANGFDRSLVYASAGLDRAALYDSDGNDTFSAQPDESRLTGPGYDVTASRFEEVDAHAGAGTDQAALFDSAGNDVLTASPTDAQLAGPGFRFTVYGFDRVQAQAGDGFDRAVLYDSSGADTLTVAAAGLTLVGDGYSLAANRFDRTETTSSGGLDRASFYDSAADDLFVGDGGLARIETAAYRHESRGFDQVWAYSFEGGHDSAEVDTVDYVFHELGDWG